MQVFVKAVSGDTITLDVDSCDTTEVFMQKLLERDGGSVPLEEQRLVFACKQLEEGKRFPLAAYLSSFFFISHPHFSPSERASVCAFV
jgi:hypothetical protein